MASEQEREMAMTNAELDAAISRAANSTPFAALLAARGETTVIMDQDGAIVVRHPDGQSARAEP